MLGNFPSLLVDFQLGSMDEGERVLQDCSYFRCIKVCATTQVWLILLWHLVMERESLKCHEGPVELLRILADLLLSSSVSCNFSFKKPIHRREQFLLPHIKFLQHNFLPCPASHLFSSS